MNAQAAAPKEGLRLLTVRDSLAATHTWYEQTYDGKPVLGAYYVEHVDKATGVKTVDDGRLAVGKVDITPAVTAEDAKTKSAGVPEWANLEVQPGAGLVDADDADSEFPASAYRSVTLSDLDGSGYLKGKYATLTGSKSKLAYNKSNQFDYTRGRPGAQVRLHDGGRPDR